MDINIGPYAEGKVPDRSVAGEGSPDNDLARAAYLGRKEGTMTVEQRDILLDTLAHRLMKRDLPASLVAELLADNNHSEPFH